MHKTSLVCKAVVMVFLLTIFSFNVSALTDGYIICGTFSGKTTVLLDKDGKTVKTWNHTSLNGYSCYLLPNGNLLWSGQSNGASPPNAAPKNGIIEEIDSTGKTVWTYTLANDSMILHHDMKPMPNGHILATSFHYVPKAAAVAAGITSSLMTATDKGLLCEKLVEIDPKAAKGKEIVWEWRLLDHIVPQAQAASHPEKFGGGMVSSLWYGQWMHCNGLDYNPDLDLIVFSSRLLSECYVIDHSASTQEAKGSTGGKYGKGGDLLYRWGNPANYGASGAYTLDCLHCTTWIPKGYPGEGNIMFFHNNQQGPGKTPVEQSQVIQIKPPVDADGKFIYESGKPYGPSEPTWKYVPTSDFYSRFMSSAMRMPNGHTIAHETYPSKDIPPDGTSLNTNSIIREVDSVGATIWKYTFAGGNVSKIMYYPSSYVGICKLLHLDNCITGVENNTSSVKSTFSTPHIRSVAGRMEFSNSAGCAVDLFNLQGKKALSIDTKGASYVLGNGLVPKGLYCAKVTLKGRIVSLQMIEVLQ
jgi:hypothetical protein